MILTRWQRTFFLLSFFLGAQLFARSETSELFLLRVDKSLARAYLETLPSSLESPQLVKSYTIATGKASGDKRKEGDHKTPEGIYFPRRHIPASQLDPKEYGKLAIALNFPNPVDRLEGKTGYGIWLHGAGDDKRISQVQVTRGCVAFYNADILDVKGWMPPMGGAVLIADSMEGVNDPSDRGAVLNSTLLWEKAWKERDHKGYGSYYHPQFKFGSRSKKNYLKYKKRVFSSYKEMRVDLSLLRVVTHPKYAVAFMNQKFHGDQHFFSEGSKILYWQKKSGEWKIVREAFSEELFKKNKSPFMGAHSVTQNRQKTPPI